MKMTLTEIKNNPLFSNGIVLDYKDTLVSIKKEETVEIVCEKGSLCLVNVEISPDYQFDVPDYLLNNSIKYGLEDFNSCQLNKVNIMLSNQLNYFI